MTRTSPSTCRPASANQVFGFIVQDLDFNFGDIIEIRAGQFVISGNEFTGSGLELFIGSGPSKLEGGAINPRRSAC